MQMRNGNAYGSEDAPPPAKSPVLAKDFDYEETFFQQVRSAQLIFVDSPCVWVYGPQLV